MSQKFLILPCLINKLEQTNKEVKQTQAVNALHMTFPEVPLAYQLFYYRTCDQKYLSVIGPFNECFLSLVYRVLILLHSCRRSQTATFLFHNRSQLRNAFSQACSTQSRNQKCVFFSSFSNPEMKSFRYLSF